MSFIVKQDGYEYAAITCGVIFLLPQIYSGLKTKELKDVSGASLLFVMFGSVLWAYYMYENDMYTYAAFTFFVTFQSLLLITLKIVFYYQRVNEHMLSFEQPPPPPPVCIPCETRV
mgnify:CR=1 FL=1